MKLLERVVEALVAQTEAISRQTEAIRDMASANRELAEAIRSQNADDGEDNTFAHLGEPDDRDTTGYSSFVGADIPDTM